MPKKAKRGVVLVFTAGILTILAAMGMAFYVMTNSSVSSAVRYSDMVRAEMLAQAGVREAIARLRKQAFIKTEDPSDPWFQIDYMNGLNRRISYAFGDGKDNDSPVPDGIIDNEPSELKKPYTRALGSMVVDNGDRFSLEVADAASKININAGGNLAVILDNLCRVIGPPLVAAEQDALQPRRWAEEAKGTPTEVLYSKARNVDDKQTVRDLCFRLDATRRPLTKSDGVALYGDGYAIAAYRSQHGPFGSIDEIRNALTYVERNGNRNLDDPLERLEVEAKFAALKDHITTDSWVDTTTVDVGKFEWVAPGAFGGSTVTLPVYDLITKTVSDVDCQILIDRDKSWVADKPESDPLNQRGSLRGAYVSIMNGHGAGQLRRIATNGADWIALRAESSGLDESMLVPPGPISSYLIMSREDALLDSSPVPNTDPPVHLPQMNSDGTFIDDPDIDYERAPLCIHRAPVNINTASDKVLAALFMGLNIQHGHPMSVGTVVRDGTTLGSGIDKSKLVPSILKNPPLPTTDTDWKTEEYAGRGMETYLLTRKGLKRIPADDGQLVFNRPRPTEATSPEYDYLDGYGTQSALNEAQELAFRVIHARQAKAWDGTALPSDPLTDYKRGPFQSWDDLYFRVVKPWDDQRVSEGKGGNEYHIVGRARMIMANFNNNTDILKFNPNIEWIDRWGRNFTEMEPVMIFEDTANEPLWINYAWPPSAASDGYWNKTRVQNYGWTPGSYYTRSLRYKSDDLIDKTDLNRSTTEFSFNSGGIYEITSTGQVTGPTGLLSERKVEALVKVYDVWRESTQAQFVRGFISEVQTGSPNPNRSGKIVRDARNTTASFKHLALETWPEALVPLQYRLNYTGSSEDAVSGNHYDAWGNAKGTDNPLPKGTPDMVANHVLPARYDGQIALATNTLTYDPGVADTFLASFNGDVDTDTSGGNGRECAKIPCDYRIRTIDMIGCLGLLNDRQIDFDPKETWAAGKPDYDFFAARSANKAMRALRNNDYWENVTCRMGDMRPEGVHLGNTGVSGKDATLKYEQSGNLAFTQKRQLDFQVLIRTWFKPSWHLDDSQEHEFFNCNTVADGEPSHAFVLQKVGKLTNFRRLTAPGGQYGGLFENHIWWNWEDEVDWNSRVKLKGNLYDVPLKTAYIASPAYRVQPFRWHYIGGALNHAYHYSGKSMSKANGLANRMRCFINTQRVQNPADWWDPAYYVWYKQGDANGRHLDDHYTGSGNPSASEPQIAAWSWSNHVTAPQGAPTTPIFSLNNLNRGTNGWLYRACPIDGTQAVVDEYKISVTYKAMSEVPFGVWYDNRIPDEMTTSRYYLPDPVTRANCPTFTSQTLLQSLRGATHTSGGEEIAVIRASWNCFTPRFMHANKDIQTVRKRVEAIDGKTLKECYYRGPFDYIQYNWGILPSNPHKTTIQCEKDFKYGASTNWMTNALGERAPVFKTVAGHEVPVLNCERPAAKHYLAMGKSQAHATAGIEIELLRDPDGTPDTGDEIVLNPGGTPFLNPDNPNVLGTPGAPVKVRAHELRYRVRFRYPLDAFVKDVYNIADNEVDPSKHFLLDTPVFDDISVTYFTKTRILSYREINE